MSRPLNIDRREPPAGRWVFGEWPLELESARWAETLANALPKPLHELGVEGARAVSVGRSEATPSVAAVVDLTVHTSAGEVPIRVYRPVEGNRLPVVLQMHGGGWTLGGLEGGDQMCRQLCLSAGCVVIAIDYPLAPEHAFPTALECCYDVMQWVVRSERELGIDPDRIAVIGDSAGGNLAAALAILCRDRMGPRIRAQALAYPVVRQTQPDDDVAWARSPLLDRGDIDWFWDVYGAPADPADARAYPLAGPLAGLPSTLVILAEVDPLREQGVQYAQALSEAGVQVSAIEYGGVFHGFFPRPAISPSALDAIEEVGAFLRATV